VPLNTVERHLLYTSRLVNPGWCLPMLLSSIRSRMLGLVVATVIPFTALIGVGLWNQWHHDQAAAVQRAFDEARLIAVRIDDYFSNIESLLVGTSRAISWNPGDTARNDAILSKIKSEAPTVIANLLLFAPDGTNIGLSSSINRVHGNDRRYFQQAMTGEQRAISEVFRSRINDRWVVTLARPIRDQTGRIRAVLAVGTQLESFQDTLGLARLPPGSIVRVVNEQGIVVAQSDNGPDVIGADLSGAADVARYIAARETSEHTAWSDGVQRITGSSSAKLVSWLVSVGLPTDIAFAPVLRRITLGALFTLATLLIASAIAWTLSGRIVRPLRQLGKDSQALAAGNFEHRSIVQSVDEVGRLADAFNRMAERLTERRQEARDAAHELRRANDALAAVIDASPVAIICCDLERKVFIWNRAAEHIFGYTAEEKIGQTSSITPPAEADDSRSWFERVINGETMRDLHLKRARKDGRLIDVRLAAAPMFNPDGSVRGVVRAYEDITERRRAEDQLQRVAHYDQLTGLPNRLSLQKQLGRLLSGGGTKEPTAIALFDLDGFKDVNDTLGHSTGDLLLIEVGSRLTEVVGARGQVCRLGGDEFIVVIPGCGDPLEIGGIIDAALQRLAEPYEINDQILHIAGSAGSAIAPADGKSVDELIANADLALYQAKADGGRGCRFYMPVMRAQAQARHSLGVELRRAHDAREFELYYQPQVRLSDEAVVGAEALIRWRHPERGILAPGIFIDTLAASSIAPAVSRWIVETACTATAKWRAEGLALGRIGVNLFPTQLGDDALLTDIDEVLQMTGLPAGMLELEITENVALNFEDAEVLQKLRDKGLMLAFDDFGTGYASLSYLTRFPLARIKIDRSFVAKITDDAGDAAIVRSLIAMAHNLGLEVIAEGVETRAQAEFLLKERCQEAQGFLFGRPLPATEFEALLRSRRVAGLERESDKRNDHAPRFQRRVGKVPGRRYYS
jgi:diguanylate cyclase (GGDEF)-like protein/PAS domain S-box-containing protein